MKLGITLVGLLAVLLAFQNCSSDLGKGSSSNSAQSSPNPSPTPGPGPGPSPSPGGQVQPNSTNSMVDVKPYNPAANCPSGYGLYDLLNAAPAVDGSSWNHSLCVKPFATGDTSVISDAQIVTGSSCAAGSELLVTIPGGGTITQPSFSMSYSICIKRQAVPVTSSFVTYFYFSSPNASCRTGDTANGDAIFCTSAGAGGTCGGMVTVKLCKSVQ